MLTGTQGKPALLALTMLMPEFFNFRRGSRHGLDFGPLAVEPYGAKPTGLTGMDSANAKSEGAAKALDIWPVFEPSMHRETPSNLLRRFTMHIKVEGSSKPTKISSRLATPSHSRLRYPCRSDRWKLARMARPRNDRVRNPKGMADLFEKLKNSASTSCTSKPISRVSQCTRRH